MPNQKDILINVFNNEYELKSAVVQSQPNKLLGFDQDGNIAAISGGGNSLPEGMAGNSIYYNGTEWKPTENIAVAESGSMQHTIIRASNDIPGMGNGTSSVKVVADSGATRYSNIEISSWNAGEQVRIMLINEIHNEDNKNNYIKIITKKLIIDDLTNDNTGKLLKIKNSQGEVEFVDIQTGDGHTHSNKSDLDNYDPNNYYTKTEIDNMIGNIEGLLAGI